MIFYFEILLFSLNQRHFQAPRKISPWIDPLEAYEFSDDCIQIDFQTNDIFGDEDCLYLNVFVPAAAIDSNETDLPVIVTIIGESFQSGSARYYGPDFLIEQNVIVVSHIFNSFLSFSKFSDEAFHPIYLIIHLRKHEN